MQTKNIRSPFLENYYSVREETIHNRIVMVRDTVLFVACCWLFSEFLFRYLT